MRPPLAAVVSGGLSIGLLAGAGCSGDDDTEQAAEEDEAPPLTTAVPRAERFGEAEGLPPYGEPDDGGEVQLVESGFSVYTIEDTVISPLSSDEDREWVTYGFVVENTSEMVALHTDIRVTLLDDSGERMADRVVPGPAGAEKPTVLLPGERFGAGGIIELGETTPTELDVEIGGSQWYPAENAFLEFADVSASEVTAVAHDNVIEPGPEIDLTIESAYGRTVSASGTAVLRDGSGAVIGGVVLDTVEVSPGTSDGQLLSEENEFVPSFDDLEVDVYLVPREPIPSPVYVGEDG